MAPPDRPTPLAPRTPGGPLARPADVAERLWKALHDEHDPQTLRLYLSDLRAFAEFCGLPSTEALLAALVRGNPLVVNERVREYRRHMKDTPAPGRTLPLSSATINRRLAALRALARCARMVGVDLKIEVTNVRHEERRASEGPTLEQLQRVLTAAAAQPDPVKTKRDVALIRVFFDLGLRREGVRTLDLAHVDLARGRLLAKLKGRREPEPFVLPPPTLEALKQWIAVRGSSPGPLFCSLDRDPAARGRRISGTGLWGIVRALGERAGVQLWPHAIRHTSITAVAVRRGLPAAQAHARHEDPKTTSRYVDRKKEMAAEASKGISELLK